MAITYYQANSVNNYIFGSTAFTPQSTYYIGLSTTAINASGAGATEPTDTAYARISVTNNKTNWTSASNGALSNAVQFSFSESTASWGTITYIFISDSLTGGNVLYYDALVTPRSVEANTQLIFAIGSIQVQLS